MTQVYFARVIDTHEPVGVFAAASRKELFWLVDECTNPNEVEVAAAPAGGIIFPAKIDATWPAQAAAEGDEDAEDADAFPSAAELTERWEGALMWDEGLRWTRLIADRAAYLEAAR